MGLGADAWVLSGGGQGSGGSGLSHPLAMMLMGYRMGISSVATLEWRVSFLSLLLGKEADVTHRPLPGAGRMQLALGWHQGLGVTQLSCHQLWGGHHRLGIMELQLTLGWAPDIKELWPAFGPYVIEMQLALGWVLGAGRNGAAGPSSGLPSKPQYGLFLLSSTAVPRYVGSSDFSEGPQGGPYGWDMGLGGPQRGPLGWGPPCGLLPADRSLYFQPLLPGAVAGSIKE